MGAAYFAIVPAAGQGTRVAAGSPKQYLTVRGRTLLEHAVRALLAEPRIEIVFVVLAPGDRAFAAIDWGPASPRVAPLFCGGASRRESVHNGLVAASSVIDLADWVLVHDAARPCLARADLAHLIDALADDLVGGILAAPVADTLKRADADTRSEGTVPRAGLWSAQTPQMFRLRTLLAALDAVRASGDTDAVTDEASAVERLGLRPRLVGAQAANPKVTLAADIALAGALLATLEAER